MQPILLDDEARAFLESEAETPALAALTDLPEDQRAAVTERHIDERGYDEIAARLGCSESVARQRVSRGLRALHARLKETSDG
jgi:RNA polymerase sigma-70 factor (ECF subfamily)